MRQEIHWRVWLIKWAIWRRLLSLILRKMDRANTWPTYWQLYRLSGYITRRLDSLQAEYPE